MIVVLVDFADAPMTRPADHFRDLFFSTGRIPTGSVREYFSEVSNNLITADRRGRRAVPPAAHAGDLRRRPVGRRQSRAERADDGARCGAARERRRRLRVRSTTTATASSTPSSSSTPDRAPRRRRTAATSGRTSGCSSGDPFNADGTQIYAYLTVPEDCRIGVCAHELGHLVFGWPDLYDTDESSEGLGNWCLMGGGSWNGRGDVPAHPSAWCKARTGVGDGPEPHDERDRSRSRTSRRATRSIGSGRTAPRATSTSSSSTAGRAATTASCPAKACSSITSTTPSRATTTSVNRWSS